MRCNRCPVANSEGFCRAKSVLSSSQGCCFGELKEKECGRCILRKECKDLTEGNAVYVVEEGE